MYSCQYCFLLCSISSSLITVDEKIVSNLIIAIFFLTLFSVMVGYCYFKCHHQHYEHYLSLLLLSFIVNGHLGLGVGGGTNDGNNILHC